MFRRHDNNIQDTYCAESITVRILSLSCQEFAPFGPVLMANEYIHVPGPAATQEISWEIDPWLHTLSPAHFHPFLIQATTNLFGVQRATPKDSNGISLAGQSEP